jgi:GntR family transcriptional regulator
MQLYKQIENEIRRQIFDGELKPGDKLPSESALMKEHNASKMTIRQCITDLAQEGLIYSIERVGNFVSTPEVDKYVLHFDELKKIKGVDEVMVTKTRFAKKQEIQAVFSEATEHFRVFVIERVFYSDEIPVATDQMYITYNQNTRITTEDMIHRSFIELMSDLFASHSVRNDLTFEARPCPPKSATILGIPEAEPVAVITQEFYDRDGKMFTCSQTICRSEYIELNATNF